MFVFIILYLQQTLQPIRSLAYCTSGHSANNKHDVCTHITGVCKVRKSTPVNTQKCNLQHTYIHTALKFTSFRPYRIENTKLQASAPHNSFVAESTLLHDTA